jgi:hypothetical protein
LLSLLQRRRAELAATLRLVDPQFRSLVAP